VGAGCSNGRPLVFPLWLSEIYRAQQYRFGRGSGRGSFSTRAPRRGSMSTTATPRAPKSGMRGARDREAEIPCRALLALPVFIGDGLRIEFEKGRVRRLETGGDQKALNRAWAAESGDRDRLGQFVLGCNPLLTPGEGTGFRRYYGSATA
jgi:hypothetical protein